MVIHFELSGVLLGLSIYNSIILDLPFPVVIYKKLLNEKVGLIDIQEIDPTMYIGLKNLLEFDGDVENIFCRNF